jgi:hypothetical protein
MPPRVFPLVVCTLLWLPFALYGLSVGTDALVRFFPDEAFYYLQTAANFARTGVSTFDGRYLTNGYHPLNFLLTAIIAALVPKTALLAAVFLVQSALLVAAAWGASRLVLRSPAARPTATALILLPPVPCCCCSAWASRRLWSFRVPSGWSERGLWQRCTTFHHDIPGDFSVVYFRLAH